MKVGVLLGQCDPSAGGAYSFQETILKYLLKAKSKHEFIVFFHGQRNFNENSSIKFVPLENIVGVNKLVKPLSEAVREHQIDIFWFSTVTYEQIDIPFIIPVWDLQHRLQPFFPEVSISGWNWDSRENFYRYVLPRAAYVIAGTEAGRREIANFYGIPYERIKIIPHPVSSFALKYSKISTAEFTKIDAIASSRYSRIFSKDRNDFLFYPAQFWPHKNHVGILHALKILREKHDLDFSVVFTGADHGNKKYIQEKVSELGLTNKVFFLGLVSFEVLSWLYKKAFALIYPTFFGPENLPPLEAFAFGCPVIASNVPGSEEQLGDAAILINPINEEEIANAVRKLYDDPALRQTLIKRGQARVSKLQENNFVDRMMLILDQFEPIRRCWTNKEIYKYPVPTETIDEDDILSHSSDDQPATAPLNEEQHSLQTLAEAIENINNLLESNNLEDANNGLKQAIEKFPDSPDLFSLHAIYKLRMKDSEGAKGILFDLIKNHPAYYPAYVNIASIFSKNGDYESASKYFEEALKLDKNNRESVYEYGSMLMSSKKYAKAKEIFETYLRNNPGDSEIRLHLQKCEGILGKVSNLKQVIEKAM